MKGESGRGKEMVDDATVAAAAAALTALTVGPAIAVLRRGERARGGGGGGRGRTGSGAIGAREADGAK